MTLDDLLDLLPADLYVAVEATVYEPGVQCGCEEMRSAVRAFRDRRHVPPDTLSLWREDFDSWLTAQDFLQLMAADLIAEIDEAYPVDLEEGDLPGWLMEWWAPVLRNPWSERLDEACVAARAWIVGQ